MNLRVSGYAQFLSLWLFKDFPNLKRGDLGNSPKDDKA